MVEVSRNQSMAPVAVPGAESGINALPDDVLLRAISHLNARQVVQTCFLSRRWGDLWRSVPRVNASHHEFDGMADTEDECDVLFKKFVNRFLMLRNPVALREFRLWYRISVDSVDVGADSEDANLSIRHALQSDAPSVEVFSFINEVHIDPAVFAPNRFLRSLLLSGVFMKPPFFRILLTSCTVLERLILRGCTIFDPQISSQTLKVLTVDGECYCTFEGPASITIPSLIDLHFSAPGTVPLLNNMESLETASVSVGTDDTQVDDICQFLRSFSGVTDLAFYYTGAMLEMGKNLQWCPKFNDLTTLTLGEWCLYADLYALIVFLQNSPNLVKLTLKRSQYPHTDQRFIGELEERSFTCEHLETVKAVFLEGLEDDPMLNSLDKFLLDNGMDKL